MWQQAIRAHTPKQQRSSKGNHGYSETEPLKSRWARWGRLLGGVNPLCSHASRLQNPPSEHLSQKHTQVNNNTAAWLRFCGDEGDRESGSGQFAARSDWHGPQRWGEKMRGNSGSVSAACSTLTLIREIKEVGACSVLWRMMLSKHVLLSVILKLFCSFRLHAKIDLNERVNIWNSSEVSDLSCHVKKLKSWSVTKIKPNTQSVFIYTHYLTLCSLSEIK